LKMRGNNVAERSDECRLIVEGYRGETQKRPGTLYTVVVTRRKGESERGRKKVGVIWNVTLVA